MRTNKQIFIFTGQTDVFSMRKAIIKLHYYLQTPFTLMMGPIIKHSSNKDYSEIKI